MKTIRLTVAQALVKFLDKQFVEVDGEETKFVKGIGLFRIPTKLMPLVFILVGHRMNWSCNLCKILDKLAIPSDSPNEMVCFF